MRRLGSEPPVSHGLCLWVGLSTVLGVNRVEENQGGGGCRGGTPRTANGDKYGGTVSDVKYGNM